MPEFADFDRRNYRTVDVKTGYGQWVATYEHSVEDVMDLALLDRLTTVDWRKIERAADLGCGTGRTAAWLRDRGIDHIDGVDLTPEMLERARSRGVHTTLTEADVTNTGLETAAYDLAIASLIDEHLPDLSPFYEEAARLVRPAGTCVVVTYHPHFIMTTGMPTHYKTETGEDVAITTHLHQGSDHVNQARQAGWHLEEMQESLINDDWLTKKPKWHPYRNHPISAAYAWQHTK